MMRRLENLDDLFGHWRNETDMYVALMRLRDFYDEKRETISAPNHQKMLEYAAEHGGAASLTAEVRDAIWKESRKMFETSNAGMIA